MKMTKSTTTKYRFFFIVDQTFTDIEKIFEYNDFLHRHPQVAIIQRVDTLNFGRIKYKIYGKNFFNQVNGLGEVMINHIWTEDNKISKIKEAFTDIMDMQGKHRF